MDEAYLIAKSVQITAIARLDNLIWRAYNMQQCLQYGLILFFQQLKNFFSFILLHFKHSFLMVVSLESKGW